MLLFEKKRRSFFTIIFTLLSPILFGQIVSNDGNCDLPMYEDWSTGAGANPCACRWIDPVTGIIQCSYGNCGQDEFMECVSTDCAGGQPSPPSGWFQGGGNYGFTLCLTTLPAELIIFSGASYENEIELYWETASEENCASFEVMYSTDGVNFESLDKVDAIGNSTVNQGYSFHHYRVGEGVHYYKLKQVDFDGYFEESTTITVDHREGFRNVIFSAIYPNPVTNEASFKYMGNNYAASISIQIFDATGKVVKEQSISNQASNLEINLSTEHLENGIYYAHISQGSVIEIKQFIVNR